MTTPTDVTAAQEAFWQVIAQQCPMIVSGDLSPWDSAAFDAACDTVVRAWLGSNSGSINPHGVDGVRP